MKLKQPEALGCIVNQTKDIIQSVFSFSRLRKSECGHQIKCTGLEEIQVPHCFTWKDRLYCSVTVREEIKGLMFTFCIYKGRCKGKGSVGEMGKLAGKVIL